MKPIKLVMSAFGSYAGVETVDFEKIQKWSVFDHRGYRGRKDYPV